MASSEVDQKFLGTFAKNIGSDNPLLSSMLFKVLGLSVLLSEQLVRARNPRKRDSANSPPSLDLYLHIIWLSREGLRIVEQYIIPMVSTFSELKVLSHKIRASFYHVYVLFHNQPSVNPISTYPRRPSTPPGLTSTRQPKFDKGKAPALGSPNSEFGPSSAQPALPPEGLEGGPVGGSNPPTGLPPANFLVPAQDFIPVALECFREASQLSEKLLWGSHPLRLSVKVEFAAFLYDCMHDYDASREMAKTTIAEVYNAQEGMDDDMFHDAADLVEILGGMANRGVGRRVSGGGTAVSSNNSTPQGKRSASQSSGRTIGPTTGEGAGVLAPIFQVPSPPRGPSYRSPGGQPPSIQAHSLAPGLQPHIVQISSPRSPAVVHPHTLSPRDTAVVHPHTPSPRPPAGTHLHSTQTPSPRAPSLRGPDIQAQQVQVMLDPSIQPSNNLQVPNAQVPQPAFPSPDMVNPI